MNENRAMVLTPPGTAAIAVVRLRGPAVVAFLCAHFSKAPAPAPGRCVYGLLRDGDAVIDDVIVASIDERTVDLNLHGGAWVVRIALDLARREGFDLQAAIPGAPIPLDGVDADSALQAEVLSHLPLARTELSVRVLLAQCDAWDQFKREAAFSPEQHAASIGAILDDRSLYYLLHPPRVAIVGSPNVGKSTLANQLFARQQSITADLPGTTRDWVGEIAEINGLAVMLLDTPGLRTSDDVIEQAAIAQSARQVQAADRVVLVLDASGPWSEEQGSLLAQFPGALRVANKCDRPCDWDMDGIGAIHTSAISGQGVDALRKAIVGSLCDSEAIEIDQPRCWTQRQRAALERAITDPDQLSAI